MSCNHRRVVLRAIPQAGQPCHGCGGCHRAWHAALASAELCIEASAPLTALQHGWCFYTSSCVVRQLANLLRWVAL